MKQGTKPVNIAPKNSDQTIKVKQSCFGFALEESYKKDIKNFRDSWVQLNIEFGIPVSNKCHIIFSHLEDFIERQKRPLGEFSEQVVEACHQKLDKIWQWYCVKNVESEIHGENFEKCINDF